MILGVVVRRWRKSASKSSSTAKICVASVGDKSCVVLIGDNGDVDVAVDVLFALFVVDIVGTSVGVSFVNKLIYPSITWRGKMMWSV